MNPAPKAAKSAKAGDKSIRAAFRNAFAAVARSLTFSGYSRTICTRYTGILAVIGLVLGFFVLNPAGTGLSVCGFQNSTGVPCPGCGLTRSVTSFLHGHPAAAFLFHPMGPAVALAFVVLAPLAVLPRRKIDAVAAWASRYDRLLGWLTIIWALGVIVWGLIRVFLVLSGSPDWQWWRGPGEGVPPFLDN